MSNYRNSHSSQQTSRGRSHEYKESQIKGSEAWMEEEFAKSGLDASYHDAWMANPHWSIYSQYNSDSGMLSGLSEGLVGTSSSQRNARDAEADARKYWAELINEARKNAYNSPLNQSSMMREAALNPNLQGIGDVAESSDASIGPDPTPMESPSSDFQVVGSIIDGVSFLTDLASNIINVRKGFKELKNLDLTNEGIDIGNSNSKVTGFRDIVSYGEWIADNMVSADSFKNYASDGDKFLEASMVTADGQIVKNYLPNGNDFQRSVLANALNNRFRSNILESKSWEDYAKLSEARNRARIAETDLEKGFSISIMACKKVKADYEAALTSWKAQLMNDDVFEELWKSNEFASLRESVSTSLANAASADISYAGSDAVLNSEEAMNDVTASAKQAFRTALEQLLEQESAALLSQTNQKIINEFYQTYATSFGANWKYRATSPEREKLDIALGIGVSGFDQAISVVDFLLKRQRLHSQKK